MSGYLIVPGTDAALIAALTYVMIKEDLLDRTFLDKYTIGFSENTLPQDAAKNSSYESYVLGLNDGVEKTPDWASKITKIPARRIVQLAREIATIKPCFIEQGWGVKTFKWRTKCKGDSNSSLYYRKYWHRRDKYRMSNRVK